MLYLELRLEALSATAGCAVKTLKEFRRKYPGAPDPPLLQPQDLVDIATGIKSAEEYITRVKNHLESLSVSKDKTAAKPLTEPTGQSEARTTSRAEIPTEETKLLKCPFTSENETEAGISFEKLSSELPSTQDFKFKRTTWFYISEKAAHCGQSRHGTMVSENPTETAAPNKDEVTEAESLIKSKDPPEAKSLTEAKDPPEAKCLTEAKDPPEAKSLTEAKDPPEAKSLTEAKDPPEAKCLTEAKDPPEAKCLTEAKDPPEAKCLTEAKDPPEAKSLTEAKDPPEAKSLTETKDPSKDKSLIKTKHPPEGKSLTKTKAPTEAKLLTNTKDPPEGKSLTRTKAPFEAKSLTEAKDPPEETKLLESHSVKGDPTGTVASHKEVWDEVISSQEDSISGKKILRKMSIRTTLSKWLQGGSTESDVTTKTKNEVRKIKVPTKVKSLTEVDVQKDAGALRGELFVDEDDFFDINYDYDFTHIKDRLSQFKRGGEQYRRPCGWLRFALKVLGKYEDGDEWLGEGDDAWPVSYHGTTMEGAKGIIKTHYKAGPCQKYGRGIYSTPDVTIALVFSKSVTSPTTKKTYNVILQNRINPKRRTKCERKDHWLVQVSEGTSSDANAEELDSRKSIRPYGLLLREVKEKPKTQTIK